jgi:acylphosphatase
LGGTLGNAVAAAANADGRLQVFATAADESVATISQTAPGGSWTTWTSLGGSVSDYLNAASGSDGRIEVFARGWENELWHLRQQAPNGGWSG